jgi:DNA invertase Pin-like site-specific DNA recombinase
MAQNLARRTVMHKPAIDTTTPAGRVFSYILGVFSEFECDMIRSRVDAGLDRASANDRELNARTMCRIDNSHRAAKRAAMSARPSGLCRHQPSLTRT